MTQRTNPIPARLKNISKDDPYVAGADDIIDDTQGIVQSEINKEVVGTVSYNSSNPNGMGRIVLKKTDDFKTVVEAQTNGNTIFVIKYDFDLNGESVTIPDNCVLEFDGGSLSNGTINGNSTVISSDAICFNESVIFTGSFVGNWCSKWWFDESCIDAGQKLNIIFDRIKNVSGVQNKTSYPCFVLNKGKYVSKTTCNLSGVTVNLDFDNSCICPTGDITNNQFVFDTVDAGNDEEIDFDKGFKGNYIKNLFINGSNSQCGGIRLYWSFTQSLVDISMRDMFNTGILIGDHSPETVVDRISLHRRIVGLDGDIVGFESKTSDSIFNNIVTVNYPIGLKFSGSNCFVTNCHPWGYSTAQGYESATMKIGIYLFETTTNLYHNVVDTYEAIDKTKSCEEVINGQLNGGCGVFVEGAYNSIVDCLNTVVPNVADLPPTIYVKSDWHMTYRDIKGRGVVYGVNGDAENSVNNDALLSVNNSDGLHTANRTVLYQGNTGEAITVLSSPTDTENGNYTGVGRIINRYFRGKEELARFIVDDQQARQISLVLLKRSSTDNTFFTFKETNLTFSASHSVSIGDSGNYFKTLYINTVRYKLLNQNTYPSWIDKGQSFFDENEGFVVCVEAGGDDPLIPDPKLCKFDAIPYEAKLSGTTSERPTNVRVGFNYFDTTLNKPIWHKGSNVWVDATGTSV